MKSVGILLVALLAMPLGGCVIAIDTNEFEEGLEDWRDRQERNDRYIRRLDLGRSIHSVESDLGEPDFVESFWRNDEEFTVLYYRTHRTRDDGRTTKDETTPLVFIDGELVGRGDSAIDLATSRGR